jgi:hypothetical protein
MMFAAVRVQHTTSVKAFTIAVEDNKLLELKATVNVKSLLL